MKNKILFWLACQIVCLPLFSTNPVPDRNNQGKWGYVDDSNNLVIGYKYDEATMFNNGAAIVRKGNKYGLISPSGKEMVSPKYNSITPAGANVYKISASGKLKDGIWIDEKYGFVAISGEELLSPIYDEIGLFTDGVAYVKKGDVYGYINSDIQIIVPIKYKAIGKFNSAGIVWVNDGGKFKKETPSEIKGGKFGIYNKSGQEIVPVKYKSFGVFSPYKQKLNDTRVKNMSLQERTVNKESGSHRLLTKAVQNTSLFSKIDENASGLWVSSKDDGSKNAVLSTKGEIIIPTGVYHQSYYPEEGVALVKSNPYTFSYVELQSGRIIAEVSGGWAFQDGVAVVQKNAQMCLINKQGQECSKRYSEIYPKKDSVYIVRDGKKFGMIDYSGKEIIAPEDNTLLFPPSHGLMVHSKDGMKGFINQKGEWVVQPKYSQAYSFAYGLASVKSCNLGKWGEIDTTGKEVVPAIWENTKDKTVEGQRYIWVTRQNNKKYMPFDVVEGKLAFENKTFAWCRNFDMDFESVALAGQDSNHVGIVNLNGEMIIPEVFTSGEASEAYEQFLKTGKPWTDVDTYRLKLRHNDERNNNNIYQPIDPTLWDY